MQSGGKGPTYGSKKDGAHVILTFNGIFRRAIPTIPPIFQHRMLRSIKQLYGENLSAADGEVGRVKDFYFDDEYWAVRYCFGSAGMSCLG
jgi:hypothetical protein